MFETGEVAALRELSFAAPGEDPCATFWGSHGCDRPQGHDGLHVCGDRNYDEGSYVLCSIHDGTWARFVVAGNERGPVYALSEPVDRWVLSEPSEAWTLT